MPQAFSPSLLQSLDHVTHVGRGSGYSFLGWGTFQSKRREHADYAPMAIYLADAGNFAVRPLDEFVDGRFLRDGTVPPNPLVEAVTALGDAQPGTPEHAHLLSVALTMARKAIVLDDNALLYGKESFDEAVRRRADVNK